ncbi:hypothetical protein L3i22_043210 [Actinoplanes sp. L3-i22]|nr:hypothetical protein L3i22_043210 [Actinoplanes sp. L3-i22]
MAVELAYQLVEAAQGHHDADRVESAEHEATEQGWDDVLLLLQFARSLAGLEDGADDTAHVDAMLTIAGRLPERSLLALATAVKAARAADRRGSTTTRAESAARLLVEAVVTLDDPGPQEPVVHRVAALIEVGNVAHELGFWELALDYFTLAEQALAGETSGRWSDTARRQQLVVTINRCELVLDWACALAAIGEWEQAGVLAATALTDRDPTDADWPPSWVDQYHGQQHLNAALAATGAPPPPVPANITALGAAIRAARAGDHGRAAALADGPATHVEVHLPGSAHLLALSLAAKQPGTTPAAIRYGDQLAALRWNDRLDRMDVMRDAIAVGRRRRDHEQLRRDFVIDELTGLANRRGYQAYLAAVGEPAGREPERDTRCAVLMVDVDHFKAVNDGFGHDVGDLVLADLGRILGAQVRQSDLAARLGGDEFVIILADTNAGSAESCATRILQAVLAHPWHELADGLTVSISIGVHHGRHHELPEVLHHADKNLYRAKNHGRGRFAATV